MKRITAALAALLLSGGVAAAATATTSLNIRSEPGVGGQVIGVIPAGQSVATLGCSDGWCKVNHRGVIGFASASYLRGLNDGAAAMAPSGVVVQPRTVIVQPQDSFAYAPVAPAPVAPAPLESYAYEPAPLGGYVYRYGPSLDSYAYERPYARPWVGFGFSVGDPRW